MSQIVFNDFCDVCVANGLYLGINPHYLAALALVRSGIAKPEALTDDQAGLSFGPYRITRDDWEQRRVANDLEGIDLQSADSNDFKDWEFHVEFAALTAYRARTPLVDSSGSEPTALTLYAAQWPGAPVVTADVWRTALDATADAVIAALTREYGVAPGPDGKIDTPTNPAPAPRPPTPAPNVDFQPNEQLFVEKAPGLVTKLVAAFPLRDFQAAAILGNLGEESGGFHRLQEKLADGSDGPGLGWAQWSFTRRTAFETYCANRGLSTSSDAGNLGFLIEELETTEKNAITALKPTIDIAHAVRVFEENFERATKGLEHFDVRDRYANLALQAFAKSDPVPAPVAALLDLDLNFQVVDKVGSGGDAYWLIEEAAEHGSQMIVKQTGATAIALARGTSVFPLPAGLVPSTVAVDFSAKVGSPVDIPPGGSNFGTVDQIAAAIFTQAKLAAGTLVTHDVPGTNNGRLACAWAVNHIARLATGHEIGGGLNSDAMCDILQAHHTRLSADSQVMPGAIVISPTNHGHTGHVGIVGELGEPFGNTLIYSNSSSQARFMQNYTVGSWRKYFNSRGLEVRFYLLKPSGAAPGQPPAAGRKVDFAFGDSLAVGQNAAISGSGITFSPDGKLAMRGGRLIGETSAPPQKILQNIADCVNADGGFFRGAVVSLSTGASNNPDQVAPIDQQIKALNAAGATVVVCGVANNGVFQGHLGVGPGLNAKLQAIALANNVAFAGGYTSEVPPDFIHRTPAGYALMVTQSMSALP